MSYRFRDSGWGQLCIHFGQQSTHIITSALVYRLWAWCTNRLRARLSHRLWTRLPNRLRTRFSDRFRTRLPNRFWARLPNGFRTRLPNRLWARLPNRFRAWFTDWFRARVSSLWARVSSFWARVPSLRFRRWSSDLDVLHFDDAVRNNHHFLRDIIAFYSIYLTANHTFGFVCAQIYKMKWLGEKFGGFVHELSKNWYSYTAMFFFSKIGSGILQLKRNTFLQRQKKRNLDGTKVARSNIHLNHTISETILP